MNIEEALTLGNELLRKHQLNWEGWTLNTNRRVKTVGLCWHGRKTIEISEPYIQFNPEHLIRGTLLHEIAHALVGPKQAHNEIWVAKALEIGAPTNRCAEVETVLPKGRWFCICSKCGRRYERHKRPSMVKTYRCIPCNERVIWQDARGFFR